MNLETVRQKMDVAITATLRPEVLDLTLFSFFSSQSSSKCRNTSLSICSQHHFTALGKEGAVGQRLTTRAE